MNFLIKYKLTFFGILLGAAGGYLYYHFVGCTSGSCPITSNPLHSTLYGALMGGIGLGAFKKDKNQTQ